MYHVGVGVTLWMCDSGASLLCVRRRTKSGSTKTSHPLKMHVQVRPVIYVSLILSGRGSQLGQVFSLFRLQLSKGPP